MSTQAPTQSEQFEFRAEIQQLLNILVHSLYTDREIFLREAISNASDALHRLQFETLTNPDILDPDVPLTIHITPDETAKTLTISDTGIGLTREELIENLGTIAHSGAKAFIEALQARGSTATTTDIIGQFGVGFYSLFMVADEVRVTTRSFHKDGQAWTWVSQGDSRYTIEPADKATRGTNVQLKLKDDADEFLKTYRLERIVTKHSNYIPFPIYVGDIDKPANQQTALWRRNPREVTDTEYSDFYKQLTYDLAEPLARVHLNIDTPVQFYSLLYVPSKAERGLFSSLDNAEAGPRLYARKVLIQEHAKDLLPNWLRFVEGVVDSEDLPLNISRETVQANRVMARLKTVISGKVIGELEALAERDANQYATFWTEFGRLVKEGVATDPTNRDRLLKLLRFRSSRDSEVWVSLAEYKARMVEGQTEIYYLFGEDVHSITRSPHLDMFRARGIEVLFLTETIDSFMIGSIPEFDGVKLRNAADADLDLPAAPESTENAGEALADNALQTLIEQFKTALGERVTDVRESKLLTDSPARLVTADKGLGPEMERVYRMLDKPFEAPKRILEINPRHPLIRNLSALPDDVLRGAVIEQLFESALLLEGVHPNPADMVPRIQALMEAATRH
ncbi:MAG: molecular chaperone HtpG [Aggregatilineales bacterium]